MNRIFRNDKSDPSMATSKHASSLGRKALPGATPVAEDACFVLKGLVVSLMLAFASTAYALPTGGTVSAGSTSIVAAPGSLTINQSSQNAAINWQSFNIGQGEAVRFVQPNVNSVALNRVLGADPSSILGSLSANGKVFLVNPNGIMFGQGAQVNVGGLVASTLNISDGDFMAGRYRFSGNGTGSVLNQGSINADGGYVALLGANVSNEGTIVARLGTVALAAGTAVTLDVAGDGLLNVTVNEGALNALIHNGGLIRADGGQVLLTAMAAGNLLHTVVNNTGVIQAQTIENRNGTIMLLGDMQSGTTNVGGTLDASAPNGGNGGFIETSAAHVRFASDAKITTVAPLGVTGTWLIDPVDFNIAAIGGDITGFALTTLLVNNNVTISTVVTGTNTPTTFFASPGQGDINVNDVIGVGSGALWTAAGTPTTLRLEAARDVNINQPITATRGNLVVCCGQDVNVRAAITTTNGSVLLNAGRDINITRSAGANAGAMITTTDGNIELCAGRDVILSNLLNPGGAPIMTLTNGSTTAGEDLREFGVPLGLTLRAGGAATEPGPANGTVNFVNGGIAGTFITVTTGGPGTPVSIFYNPINYSTPTPYSLNFTGTGGPVTSFMLVYPDGVDKVFDNTTTATLSGFRTTATSGPVPAGVTLAGAGTANFDTPFAGLNKTITYSGFTLAQGAIVPGDAALNFALPTSCCLPRVGRTTGNITPVPPIVPPILPIVPPIDAPEGTIGPEAPPFQMLVEDLPVFAPGLQLAVTQTVVPGVMMVLAAPPPPVVVPVQTVVPVETVVPPVIAPPPPRPPKQDRN